MGTAHQQTWVKVNAQVDRGMARLIAALNSLPGLQTVQSCEGISGESEAYVFFWYGSWQRVSDLVFSVLIPALQKAEIAATGSVEVFNGSPPTGKIAFPADALMEATSALEGVLLARQVRAV